MQRSVYVVTLHYFYKMDKSTTNTFSEKGTWVRFGIIPFYIRPMTLKQIWEIGELVNKCGIIELQGQFNAIEQLLKHSEDLKKIQKVVITAIFRSSISRVLMGWYIKKKTTMKMYQRVITICAKSFDAPFFFQSMISLRGAKKVAMNTHEVQAHGDL